MHEKSGNTIHTVCVARFWVTLAQACSFPSLPGLLPLLSSSLLSFPPLFFEYELISPYRLTNAVSLSSFTEMSQHLSLSNFVTAGSFRYFKIFDFFRWEWSPPIKWNCCLCYSTLSPAILHQVTRASCLLFCVFKMDAVPITNRQILRVGSWCC